MPKAVPDAAGGWWDADEIVQERKFVKANNDLKVGDELTSLCCS